MSRKFLAVLAAAFAIATIPLAVALYLNGGIFNPASPDDWDEKINRELPVGTTLPKVHQWLDAARFRHTHHADRPPDVWRGGKPITELAKAKPGHSCTWASKQFRHAYVFGGSYEVSIFFFFDQEGTLKTHYVDIWSP